MRWLIQTLVLCLLMGVMEYVALTTLLMPTWPTETNLPGREGGIVAVVADHTQSVDVKISSWGDEEEVDIEGRVLQLLRTSRHILVVGEKPSHTVRTWTTRLASSASLVVTSDLETVKEPLDAVLDVAGRRNPLASLLPRLRPGGGLYILARPGFTVVQVLDTLLEGIQGPPPLETWLETIQAWPGLAVAKKAVVGTTVQDDSRPKKAVVGTTVQDDSRPQFQIVLAEDLRWHSPAGVYHRPSVPECLVYILYHSVEHHHHIVPRANFRPMRMNGDMRDPHDLDAQTLFPMIRETFHQNNLCEFGAMLGIADHLDRIHHSPWIGFTSWKEAQKKGSARRVVWPVLNLPQENQDVLFFWYPGTEPVSQADLYGSFDEIHPGANATLNKVFQVAFNASVPPMPIDGDPWSYASYWIMSVSSFRVYVKWIKILASTLYNLYGNHLSSTGKCPYGRRMPASHPPGYYSSHCFCYFLERMINVWGYHSGRRFVFLDVKSARPVHHTRRRVVSSFLSDWVIHQTYDRMKQEDRLRV